MKHGSLLLLAFSLLSLIITGCKSREDIAREQLMDNIAIQLKDGQNLSADITTRLQNLEENLASVTGKVEEGDHSTKQNLEKRILDLEEKLGLITEQNKTNQTSYNEQISSLNAKLADQDKYLKQVLSTLNKMSSPKSASKNSNNKKGAKKLSPYDEAIRDYQKGRYKTAYPKLLKLSENKKIKGAKKARLIHNLGMVQFIQKKPDQAMIFFSRLYTEFPKSGYNKNGLLFLGKSFKKLGRKEEAKQVLSELVTKWPKAKHVKEANKLLKVL